MSIMTSKEMEMSAKIEYLITELEKRDKIISRLKEDAEALYSLLLHSDNNFIEHDNRMIGHRALMKELE